MNADPEDGPSIAHRAGSAPRLGVWDIVFFVIASAAPLTGTLGAVPMAIAVGNGPGAGLAFLLVGVVLAVFSVGYTCMSRHVAQAGAFYAYIGQGLGGGVGTGSALVAVVSYTAVQLALYGLFGFFCVVTIPAFAGVAVPWWLYAAGALMASDLLTRRGVEVNATLLGILMLLEIGIVVAVVAAIMWHGGPDGLSLDAFAPRHVGDAGFGVAAMFAFACFIGFEATAIYAPEARNPTRTIPRATYASLAIITIFFALACWAIGIAYGLNRVRGAALADPGNLWFAVAQARLGFVAAAAMKAFLISSILAFHNALARYVQVVARDGYVWRRLAAINPVTGNPDAACRFQTIVGAVGIAGAVMLSIDPYGQLFAWLSAFATIGIVSLQILVSLAVIRFFRGGARSADRWQTLIAPTLSAFGLSAILIVMIHNLPALTGTATTGVYAMPVVLLFLLVGRTFAARHAAGSPVAPVSPICSSQRDTRP